MDKISDLKELKALKKKLASTEEKAEGAEEKQPSRRDRTVRNKSRAEHKAAEDGICLGMRVKLMDSNDYAVVKAFSDKGYCIECNGIEFMAQRSEFVLAPQAEEELLSSSVPARKTRAKQEKAEEMQELTVDLHLDQIPGSYGVPEWAALDYQMNYFRQILNANLKHKGRRIIFIHGVGDGTLAKAIRKELGEAYALSCSYSYGAFGSTAVTVR